MDHPSRFPTQSQCILRGYFTSPSEISTRSPSLKAESESNIQQGFATITFQIIAPSPLLYVNSFSTAPPIHLKNHALHDSLAFLRHGHPYQITLATLQPHRPDRLDLDVPGYVISTPASSNPSGNLSRISLARRRPT